MSTPISASISASIGLGLSSSRRINGRLNEHPTRDALQGVSATALSVTLPVVPADITQLKTSCLPAEPAL